MPSFENDDAIIWNIVQKYSSIIHLEKSSYILKKRHIAGEFNA